MWFPASEGLRLSWGGRLAPGRHDEHVMGERAGRCTDTAPDRADPGRRGGKASPGKWFALRSPGQG